MPTNSSRAAGNFFGLLNAEGAGGLARKVLIIGQQLATFDLPEERVEVANAASVASDHSTGPHGVGRGELSALEKQSGNRLGQYHQPHAGRHTQQHYQAQPKRQIGT